MEIILLEKIDSLGAMGEQVKVKDGYARNYLLPQKKALRATPSNLAFFQKERAALEAANAKKRDAAAKEAKKVEGLTVTIIRQASEAGSLYGSVAARDVAEAVAAESKVDVTRNHVLLNTNFKTLGLFPVTVALHPEVKVNVTVNIARSLEEAEIQKKTGKALIKTDEDERPAAKAAPAEEQPAEEASEEQAA